MPRLSSKSILDLEDISGIPGTISDRGRVYTKAGSTDSLFYLSPGGTETELTGGGGTPGGSDTQVQFNESGSFGGDSEFVWNTTSKVLTVTGKVTAQPSGAGSSVEVFGSGSGSNITANNVTVLGNGAATTLTSGADNVFIGSGADAESTSTNGSVAIGHIAHAASSSVNIGRAAGFSETGGNNVIIGTNAGTAVTSGTRNVIIGSSVAITTGNENDSTIVGYNGESSVSDAIGLGADVIVTTANTFVAGSSGHQIDNVFFGKGESNASPTAYTINGTAGSGTDIAGANLNLAGGQGTGTGAGGKVAIKVAPPGTTGSSLNSLDDAMVFDAESVQTTDATETTIWSLALSDETTYHVRGTIIGVESDGSNRASYDLTVTAYRTGAGSATIQGTVTSLHAEESDTNWNADFDVNSNDLRIRVTGVASTTINWVTTVEYRTS